MFCMSLLAAALHSRRVSDMLHKCRACCFLASCMPCCRYCSVLSTPSGPISHHCLTKRLSQPGCWPLQGANIRALISNIVRGTYPHVPPRFSPQLRELVSGLLDTSPKRRLSVHQVLAKPVMKRRIENFLSQTGLQQEFAHTVIHGRPAVGALVVQAPAVSQAPAPAANGNAAAPVQSQAGGAPRSGQGSEAALPRRPLPQSVASSAHAQQQAGEAVRAQQERARLRAAEEAAALERQRQQRQAAQEAAYQRHMAVRLVPCWQSLLNVHHAAFPYMLINVCTCKYFVM